MIITINLTRVWREKTRKRIGDIAVKILVITIGKVCGKNQLKFCEFLNSQDFELSF